jgi:hypothetical protein
MGAVRGPPHRLVFGHARVDQMVHARFGVAVENPPSVAPRPTIVEQEVRIAAKVTPQTNEVTSKALQAFAVGADRDIIANSSATSDGGCGMAISTARTGRCCGFAPASTNICGWRR